MWLEEMAWLWLPVAGAWGIWMVWRLRALSREVRLLRQRLARLEAESPSLTPTKETAA